MQDRYHQLQFCSVCKNRKKDPEMGIICQLTGKLADFADTCNDFDKDAEQMLKNQLKRNEIRKKRLKSDFVFGLDRIGITNGIVAGFLLIAIGFTWLIIGFNMGLVFWYPVILILMGVTALIIGIFNSVRRSIRMDQNEDTDDDILDEQNT